MKHNFPIIEKLGGRDAVFEKLKNINHKRTKIDAIRMWLQRKKIPRDAIIELMILAEKEKILYKSKDFLYVN